MGGGGGGGVGGLGGGWWCVCCVLHVEFIKSCFWLQSLISLI